MSTISSFRKIKNKHDVSRGKDYVKRFCEFLREHAMNIIDFFLKNEVINKRAAGNMLKCKNLLHSLRKI